MTLFWKLLLISLAFTCTSVFAVPSLTKNPKVIEFIDEINRKHGFDKDELNTLFAKTKLRDDIIKAISRPAEGKPWYEYRPIFLTKTRISEGVKFMQAYAKPLAKAEGKFGVPREIITAIIGVETRYGKYRGKYRVMDSLATLAFNYPRRATFFRKELEQYLLLTREENVDPLSLTGSYAGAMGQPQFISSSFRRFAIDFDGDGKRDLWENTVDVIGSVANYLSVHGWEKGQPITTRVKVDVRNSPAMVEKGMKPSFSVKELRDNGVTISKDFDDGLQGALIALKTKTDSEYWIGFQNFYSITRYNHSTLYAMAVTQLGQEILAAKKGEKAN